MLALSVECRLDAKWMVRSSCWLNSLDCVSWAGGGQSIGPYVTRRTADRAPQMAASIANNDHSLQLNESAVYAGL